MTDRPTSRSGVRARDTRADRGWGRNRCERLGRSRAPFRNGPVRLRADRVSLRNSGAWTGTAADRSLVAIAVLAAVTILLMLSGPPVAHARGGDDARVRAQARCGHAARTRLDLRARDGVIRAAFELEHGRSGETWRIVIVQEDRVVWRGSRRLGAGGRLEVERRLRDLPGGDRVWVRASGPRGTACGVSGTLPG